MSDALLDLIAELAVAHARAHDLTIPATVAYVQGQLARVRRQYRRIGAPYGDDDDGLLRWLRERPAPAA